MSRPLSSSLEMKRNENIFWKFSTLMSFDLSHLVWYLHSWYPSITKFSEYLKFAQVNVPLLLSYLNFEAIGSHLIPIQILQKLVFSFIVQYFDQLPTMKLVFFFGSNSMWLSLLSMGKNNRVWVFVSNKFWHLLRAPILESDTFLTT